MKLEQNGSRALIGIPLLLAASAACSQPPQSSLRNLPSEAKEEAPVQDRSAAQPVAGLPFAHGRTFTSLDEYLAFRKARGAYDVPWYREIRPGVYELVSRRAPGADPRVFSRAELAREFGFTE